MNRHINALVNFLVFSFALGVFAWIFAHLLNKYGEWGLVNQLTLFVLCLGSLGLLTLAIHEYVIIRKLKAKYLTVI